MDTAFLITAFITMFVVIDPIALTPMFLAMTQGLDAKTRRKIALRACLTGAGVLTAFALFGEALMGVIGISIPAFRIAGGMLLFLTALDMLFERRTKRREDRAELEEHPDPSVFPLAIPIIAGPGAIASVILLTGQMPGAVGLGGVIGVLVLDLSLVYVCFLGASFMERIIGKTGINVMTRLLGMLLAALAVQFVIDGLRGTGLLG